MNAAIEATAYKEEQRTPWWWCLAVVPAFIGAWVTFVLAFLPGMPAGNPPPPDWLVWTIWAPFGVVVPWLVAALKLVVEVGDEGVRVRFSPFPRRTIPFQEIAHVEVRTYRPIREYGGWGWRYSWSNGWAYTMRGDRGVQITLIDGRKVLIGSAEPERLAEAIREATARK